MKKSAMLLAGLLTCFGLVSCDDSATPETASLYGVINDCLVGKIDITYTGKTVSEAKIDEAYFLTQTALLPAEHEGIADTDTISVTVESWSGLATNTYSKYMKVGDTVYTGTLREATSEEYGLAEYIKWTSSSTDDLFNSVKSSAAAAEQWYNDIVNGNVNFCTATGTVIEDIPLGYKTAGYTTPNKAAEGSTYWPQTETVMGWKGNIAKVEDALCIDYSSKPVVNLNDDKIWWINNTASGATIERFAEYVDLVYNFFVSAE